MDESCLEEGPRGPRPIVGVVTGVTAFVGSTPAGQPDCALRVRSWADFEAAFGGPGGGGETGSAVRGFFANGGAEAYVVRVTGADGSDGGADEPPSAAELLGDRGTKTGLYALEGVEGFDLLHLPDAATLADQAAATALLAAALDYCEERRAMLLIDPPPALDADGILAWVGEHEALRRPNAALYFPRLRVAEPPAAGLRTVGPGGAIAGLLARVAAERGVWTSPAGSAATLEGVEDLELELSDDDVRRLNPPGINTLRRFPGRGAVAWGARTLAGAEHFASEWRYLPVRRLALFLEESLRQGLEWTVFEPDDETLWAQLRRVVETFLQGLFRAGAFQGARPQEAYFVRCDATTTTAADVEQGVLNLQVGFAPLRPAELLELRLQLRAMPGEG